MEKPSKPKNYNRNCVGIYILCLTVGLGLNIYSDNVWYDALGLCFAISLPVVLINFVYRSYMKQHAAYLEHQISVKRDVRGLQKAEQAKHSRVNENIENYLKAQRERKAKAKWWEFWV